MVYAICICYMRYYFLCDRCLYATITQDNTSASTYALHHNYTNLSFIRKINLTYNQLTTIISPQTIRSYYGRTRLRECLCILSRPLLIISSSVIRYYSVNTLGILILLGPSHLAFPLSFFCRKKKRLQLIYRGYQKSQPSVHVFTVVPNFFFFGLGRANRTYFNTTYVNTLLKSATLFLCIVVPLYFI